MNILWRCLHVSGRTADKVCFSRRVRNLLPQRYNKDEWASELAMPSQFLSMHEKGVVFDLAADVDGFYQLEIILQVKKFS